MAGSSARSGTPETDITALKEVLYTQQRLLQKLYTELDEEREASATAASEALSMILRLQGEKATVKMEAGQYERMAEEKMCHAEESLAVFEDLIHHKEMEIASLESQMQAYKCKLLSLGCSDVGAFENRYPENLLQRNDPFIGEMGVNGDVRRINSLPPMQLKDSLHKKVILEREISVTPDPDLIPRIVEENTNQEDNVQSLELEKKSENFTGGDFNSYWEQIRKIEKRVKEISGCKDSGRGKSATLTSDSRYNSLLSQISTGTFSDPTTVDIFANLNQVKRPESILEKEGVVDSARPSSIHDVFEVPETKESRKACECQKKEQSELILECQKRLRKPDLVLEENVETHFKDQTDRVKKMLVCANHENKLSKPGCGMRADCHLALFPGVAEFQANTQQLGQRIEQLGGERNSIRQEISDEDEEGVKLLKEIREQLNSIQSEMRSWRAKKSPPPDDSPLLSVMEAMLYFWL